MNVLFILPELYPHVSGGICTYYTQLLKENSLKKGWNVTVVQGSASEARGGINEYFGSNINFLELDELIKFKTNFEHLNFFPELQNHLAAAWAMYDLANSLEKTFDIVICTDWGLGFIPWIINQKIPVITHLHGSIGQIDLYDPRPGLEFWSDLYLNIESTLLGYSNDLITHSENNINFWHKRLVKEKTINLIPPSFIIDNESKCEEESTSTEITNIIIVGRIQEWKGPIQLCEAINLLPSDARSKINIAWIGKDTFYSKANCSMSTYLTKVYPDIWKKIVKPQGEKNRIEIREFYKKADLAIVCSTWDMFNLSALEHLQYKKPLICSTGAGVSNYFNNIENIFLYDNTSKGLADTLTNILSNEKLKKSDFENVLRQFDSSINYKKHHKLMLNTIKYFESQQNIQDKFEWLKPKKNSLQTINSKEKLINMWPLKEIIKIFYKRLIESIKY